MPKNWRNRTRDGTLGRRARIAAQLSSSFGQFISLTVEFLLQRLNQRAFKRLFNYIVLKWTAIEFGRNVEA